MRVSPLSMVLSVWSACRFWLKFQAGLKRV